ncbi:MAG: HEPN domain-containing protein [Saprospiraceae bacterium]|nr:HEPN domain-containing protein [Saprospiraceae bacterium]
MSYSKEELIHYRIERAREAFIDTVFLIGEKRWNAAANRMYYACFYIVSAYLAFRNLNATTHSGLKSAFNLELVKTGKINREDGILFNGLFNIRQQADYEDFMNIQEADVLPLVPKVEALIQEIEYIIYKERNN